MRQLTWTADATRILAPDGPDVVVLDAATLHETGRLVGHSDVVTSVAVLPGGTRAVSASEDGSARVWDLASGHVVRELDHQSRLASVTVSPSGLIATTSRDGAVQVWNDDGILLQRTRVATQEALSVEFVSEGRQLMVATTEGVDERVGFGSPGGPAASGSVQVLDCPVCRSHDELVQLARSQAIRPLTDAESASALDGAPAVSTPAASTSASTSTAAPAGLVGTFHATIRASDLKPEDGYLAGDALLRVLPDGRLLVYTAMAGGMHGTVRANGQSAVVALDVCATDATYTWSNANGTLRWTTAHDDCDQRRLLLTTSPFQAG